MFDENARTFFGQDLDPVRIIRQIELTTGQKIDPDSTLLVSYEDLGAFKLFCSDVGLLGVLSGLDPALVVDGSRLFTEFKGALTEQYVEQELRLMGFEPVYWSSDKGTAEIDFAIQLTGSVVPIEVKAEENLQAKSLRVACDKFGLERALRTSLSAYRDEGRLVNIPLWAVSQVAELVRCSPEDDATVDKS